MKTSISVPVWDSAYQSEFTINFGLELLNETTDEFHLTFVDNASDSQETIDFLRMVEGDPRVTVLRQEQNIGYGRAANLGILNGIRNHGCDYGLILNNDTQPLQPNWISDGFLKHMPEDQKALLGARLIDFNEATRFNGDIIPYLEGWCLFFHKQFVEDVGLFDPQFLAWYEDVDLSVRAREKGYRVLQSPAFGWTPDHIMVHGTIVHFYGRTGFKKMDFNSVSTVSRSYFMVKHNLQGALVV